MHVRIRDKLFIQTKTFSMHTSS